MIENNMILTDEMKRRIKEECERLQKERVEKEEKEDELSDVR